MVRQLGHSEHEYEVEEEFERRDLVRGVCLSIRGERSEAMLVEHQPYQTLISGLLHKYPAGRLEEV
jgi:hypothetical protein